MLDRRREEAAATGQACTRRQVKRGIMDIQFWTNLAAIVGVPIALLALRYQMRQSDRKINSLNEIINLQNKYNSQGSQYHNCTFYGNSVDASQISNEYQKGIGEVK